MIRKLHRLIGLVMLLPFVAWAATGAIFFTKPGYGAAYDALPIRTYPMERAIALQPDQAWREIRVVRTILGSHLLVRTSQGWAQLDPVTLQPRPSAPEGDLTRLIEDAFTVNPQRYGRTVSLADGIATTDTGAVITLDWNRLSLQQRGRDTDRIDLLYKVHYLQWTGQKNLDKALGFTGLVLLLALTILGARLALR